MMSALVPAALLLAACIATWFVAAAARPAARVHLRFASVLFAALAIAAAAAPDSRSATAVLVLPVALTVLALAAAAGAGRTAPMGLAAALLGMASLAGLGAAASGIAALALAPAVAAAIASAWIAARRLRSLPRRALEGLASALCFLGAASSCALEGAGGAMVLFSAAGLLGAAMALVRSEAAVEDASGPDLRHGHAIGGGRKA